MNLNEFEKNFKEGVEQLLKNCITIQERLISGKFELDGTTDYEEGIHAAFVSAMTKELVDLDECVVNEIYTFVCLPSPCDLDEKGEESSPLFNISKHTFDVLSSIHFKLSEIKNALTNKDGEETKDDKKAPRTYEDWCEELLSLTNDNITLTCDILNFIGVKEAKTASSLSVK